MFIFDLFRINAIKAENKRLTDESKVKQEQIDSLTNVLKETERLSLAEIQAQIVSLEQKRSQAEQTANAAVSRAEAITADMQAQLDANSATCQQVIAELQSKIEDKKKHLVILDEEILLQSFGFYRHRFNFSSSAQFKERLDRNGEAQSRLIKSKEAASCPANWTLNGSTAQGQKMVSDIAKLLIRSFNNECDACVAAVKYNNVDSMEKRIHKAFEALNTLGERTHVSLVNHFLNLKLEELYLTHEYQVMRQNEREEQKRIREQQREEARILREIEELKSKLEKEEKHFDKALNTLTTQLQSAETESEKQVLTTEIRSIEQKKAEVEEQKKDVLYREQNTRAGYVYVISNIGSFGEDIYKIGVTRRLDPEERVDELGDASVPFYFDVHAFIFSDDAPALENALHQAFEDRRLNAVNRRKEFFRVTIDEIEAVVRNNFSKPVEFTRTSTAEEFRQTQMLRRTIHEQPETPPEAPLGSALQMTNGR